MNSKYIRIIVTTSLLLLILTFSSCGKKYLGFGTVLWSDKEESIQTGQVVTIISESELADMYLVNDGTGEESVQMERWRVSFFEEKDQAEENALEVLKYKTIFARNLKDGLLIRERPDINSQRVYKMRKDQIIKIYGKIESVSTIGQYEGFWYKVLTEDGIAGYCFDHYLDIFDSSVKPEEKVDPAELLMESAFTGIYYPAAFVDMINKKAIDLSLFKPQTGFFPDPENKNVKIVTNGYSVTFKWETLSLIDKRSFELDDSGLEITVFSDTKLQVRYYYQDEKVITNYVVIENIEDIIIEENERREALFTSLIETGTNYTSSAYGQISIGTDGSFSWIGYQRLTPQIIPDGSGGTGKIRFDKFLSPSLREEYTGVISFEFKYGEEYIPVNFLYSLEERKLRLTYIPENDFEEKIVRKKSNSPIVIAFSAK